MEQKSIPPRGAVDPHSTAPRVRLGALARRIIVTLSTGTALVWIVMWAIDEGPNPPASSTNKAPLEVRDLRSLLVRDSNGKPLWQIAADSVQVSSDSGISILRNVSRGVFFRDGNPFLTMNARLVRVSASRDLDATGGVQAKGPDGFSFQTPRAQWWNRAQRVDCPEPVKATLRGLDFTSPQLRYEWAKGQLSCPKPVEVKGEGVTLRGNRLNVKVKERLISLPGGVEMVFDPRVARPKQLSDLVPR